MLKNFKPQRRKGAEKFINGSNVYLSLFLFVVGLQLTFKVISKTWVSEHALIAYVISYKLPYLIGPLLFLFVKSKKEKKWNLLDLMQRKCIEGKVIVPTRPGRRGSVGNTVGSMLARPWLPAGMQSSIYEVHYCEDCIQATGYFVDKSVLTW